MYYVYVLENILGKKYIGQTSDLAKRLLMHNDKDPMKAKFHRFTYNKGPWNIIFQKEFLSRNEAIKYEKYLKTGKGREWLKRAH